MQKQRLATVDSAGGINYLPSKNDNHIGKQISPIIATQSPNAVPEVPLKLHHKSSGTKVIVNIKTMWQATY